MGSITKTAGGKYRAQVFRAGVRKSKVLPTRKAAKEWAARAEYMLSNAPEINSKIPFGDLLKRYATDVSSEKKGWRSEMIRLARIGKGKIARIPLGELSVTDFAEWRDMRLGEVKPPSVRRELEQMSAVLRVARTEWAVMSHNPLKGLRWPADSPPRDRIATEDEIERLRVSAGSDLSNKTARAFHAWLFAIETGMRAGEIAKLRPKHIKGRKAHLLETKNGDSRDVPLSLEAVRLLDALPDADPVFDLTSDQISSLFKKVRVRAGVENLTFHDSRHISVTRLARKLNVLELAKMIGHRDIKMLMRYYDEDAENIAKRLD